MAVVLALGLWFALSDRLGGDWFIPTPPAPDVVATFEGGEITLADVEAHLDLLVPDRPKVLANTPDSDLLISIVQDLISERLVRRWAADRKLEGEETFRHAMKHIDEELSLDELARQLHEGAIGVNESEIRDYYEKNKQRFDNLSFDQAREPIRQLLVAQREPKYIEQTVEQLKANASISRSFELLDVPAPSEERLRRYYAANIEQFRLPRRAVVDELEIPIAAEEATARARASDALLKIRSGATFEDAGRDTPGARVSAGIEVPEGARGQAWEQRVFALTEGKVGSVFSAGSSLYVVRLRRLDPARTQTLDEARPAVSAAVRRQATSEWFQANAGKTLFTLKSQRYTLGQFYKEYQELPPTVQRRYAGPQGLRELAEALIERMLLVADTYDRLLDVNTQSLSEEYRLRLLRQIMDQEEVDDQIDVTEAEMQGFYRENIDKMASPPKARVRYIRIGLGNSEDEERRARERIEEAYRKLVPGLFKKSADLAAVAREYSEDPQTASKGGELPGWIGESEDLLTEIISHPFHEAIARVAPGGITKPFAVGDSVYIVQVIERTEPEKRTFEQAKPHIRDVLRERKHRALAAELRDRLLADANVTVYPGVLEKYIARVSAKPRAARPDS